MKTKHISILAAFTAFIGGITNAQEEIVIEEVSEETETFPETEVDGVLSGPELRLWISEGRNFRSTPDEPAIGIVTVEGNLFELDGFAEDSDLQDYVGRGVAQEWSGNFSAPVSGEYVFVLDFVKASESNQRKKGLEWVASLTIGGVELIGANVDVDRWLNGTEGFRVPFAATIYLEEGEHDFALFTNFANQKGEVDYEPFSLVLKMRSPTERKLGELTAYDIYTR